MTEQKEQREEFINEKTPRIHGDSKWYRKHLKERLTHAYMCTDFSFDWPNSHDGDLLKLTNQLLVVLDQEEREPAQPTFKVGEYYVSANKQTYKLISKSKTNECWLRLLLINSIIVTSYVSEEELSLDRKATADEIARFKRAEHFHSKNRKYSEFKNGDIVQNKKTGKIGYAQHVDEDGDVVVVYKSDKVLNTSNYKCAGALYLDLIMTAEELEAAQEVRK